MLLFLSDVAVVLFVFIFIYFIYFIFWLCVFSYFSFFFFWMGGGEWVGSTVRGLRSAVNTFFVVSLRPIWVSFKPKSNKAGGF